MRNTLRALPAMLLAILALTLGGCNENDPVTPSTDKPNPPTSLMATSVNSESVGLKWTIPATGVTPTGYRIMYMEKGSSVGMSTQNVVGGTTTKALVTGLTEGKVYTFEVHSLNDTVTSIASGSLDWSPASRTTTELRMYETASLTFGSGMELPGSANLTIGQGERWDLCFDSREAGGLPSYDIGAPGASSYTDDNGKFPDGDQARVTMLSSKIDTNITDLNDLYESADLSSGTLTEGLINFNNRVSDNKPFVFVVKTQTGNFAKVRVKPVGGTILQGTAPNRYITVEVSYQNTPNQPYAIKYKPMVQGNTKKYEAGGQIVRRDGNNAIVR